MSHYEESTANVIELGVTCCNENCKSKPRSKFSKPWRKCKCCKRILCIQYNCTCTGRLCFDCNKALDKRISKLEMELTYHCYVCEEEKPLKDFENGFSLLTEFKYGDYKVGQAERQCKSCKNKTDKSEDHLRKAQAVPGVVEVQAGELPVPKKDGNKGTAYFSSTPLKLGDLVMIPNGKIAAHYNGYQECVATIVSTYSSFDGPTRNICSIKETDRV